MKAVARRPIIAPESPLTKDAALSSLDATSEKIAAASFLTSFAISRIVDLVGFGGRCGWVLFFKASLTPSLTATGLLESASIAEQTIARMPDTVRHRVINLEERRGSEAAIVARRKVEIWENRAKGDRATRLYDDSNRMVAGVWQTADGARTSYHHGSQPQSQPSSITPDNLLLNLEDVWQLEPSAQAFNTLIAEPSLAAKTDRNEQVTLTRSAGGSLRVEGIVDTQQRKDEFLRALAPVSNNPAVK